MSEILRFSLVGGLSFLLDFVTLIICKQYVLPTLNGLGLYFATGIGFLVGVSLNYKLSISFVFLSAKNSPKSRSLKTFAIFLLLSFMGFIITELGMYLGVRVFMLNYMFAKVLVTGVVLIWNYITRKAFIFNSMEVVW